jgi:hypothetical protein
VVYKIRSGAPSNTSVDRQAGDLVNRVIRTSLVRRHIVERTGHSARRQARSNDLNSCDNGPGRPAAMRRDTVEELECNELVVCGMYLHYQTQLWWFLENTGQTCPEMAPGLLLSRYVYPYAWVALVVLALLGFATRMVSDC